MRVAIIILLLIVLTTACSTPTEPDARVGPSLLRAVCDDRSATALICVAQSSCTSPFPCNDPAGSNVDITARAEWSVGDTAVLRQLARNTFAATGPGSTVVRVRDPVLQQEQNVRVSVFPGTGPLLTTEVWGRVTESGTRADISGALIEITNGLVAGRTAQSGTAPALLPGYLFILQGSNGFQIFGVPRGTYELSIRANGYAPQTRSVTVEPPGSLGISFELVRQ